MTEEEKTACGYLPRRLAEGVRDIYARYGLPMAEIRLRAKGPLSVTLGKRGREGINALCGLICLEEELQETTEKLCGGSLYSHFESIRQGVILTAEGLRCGVAGRAVVSGDRVDCVRDISSISIRIPHRVPGAADALYKILCREKTVPARAGQKSLASTLLLSPPGMGKTTLLRELIPCIAEGETPLRVAVIDTRYELGAGMSRQGLADYYGGWPRPEGILAAIRTMSPQVILCDEIAEEQDCRAVRGAVAAGVTVIATAHGDSLCQLKKNPLMASLIEDRVFACICGIGEEGVEVLARYE